MVQSIFEFGLLTCKAAKTYWTMKLQKFLADSLFLPQTGTHAAEQRSHSIGGDDEQGVADTLRVITPVPGSHSQPAHTGWGVLQSKAPIKCVCAVISALPSALNFVVPMCKTLMAMDTARTMMHAARNKISMSGAQDASSLPSCRLRHPRTARKLSSRMLHPTALR